MPRRLFPGTIAWRPAIAAAAMIFALSLSPPAVAQNAPKPPRESFVHGGLERTYFVQAPPKIDPKAPPAIIVALHGGTRSADDVFKFSGLPNIAAREGAILLAPNAYRGSWNDGRKIYHAKDDPTGIDDVGFLVALIDQTIAKYGADAKKVLVTGASNGGHMSWRLACERGEKIAAIAPAISTMPADAETLCAKAPPKPVILFVGTKDALIPYDGAPVKLRDGRFSEARLSAPASSDYWARKNGCALPAGQENVPDSDRSDRTRVVKFAYPNCPRGLSVVRYDVIEGGHIAPGSRADSRLVRRLLGQPNYDMSADEASWRFFKEQIG